MRLVALCGQQADAPFSGLHLFAELLACALQLPFEGCHSRGGISGWRTGSVGRGDQLLNQSFGRFLLFVQLMLGCLQLFLELEKFGVGIAQPGSAGIAFGVHLLDPFLGQCFLLV